MSRAYKMRDDSAVFSATEFSQEFLAGIQNARLVVGAYLKPGAFEDKLSISGVVASISVSGHEEPSGDESDEFHALGQI